MHHLFLSFRRTLLGICLLLLCWYGAALAQPTDTLRTANGQQLVGKIKSMERGILVFSTDYSKSDFQIEWSKLVAVSSQQNFFISLSSGERYNAKLRSSPDGDVVQLLLTDGQVITTRFDQIVFLKSVASKFWDGVKFNMDMGLNITSSNKLRQYTLRTAAGYWARRWRLDANFNGIRSRQDSAAIARRLDAAIIAQHFLSKGYFAMTGIFFLSNTRQAIQLRSNTKLGVGKVIFQSNRRYAAAGGGMSINHESFTTTVPSRTSWEAFVGGQLHLFDIGDLNLLSQVFVYPSLTESGRWRCDVKFDLKYDLPMDFYIKPGITLNYDNRPAIKGRESDYVFMFTVGWEL
jgi:hypothetical protein